MLALALLAFVFSVTGAVTLLVTLIVVCVVIALIAYVVNQMVPPEPICWAIWGIVLIFIVLGIVRFFGLA